MQKSVRRKKNLKSQLIAYSFIMPNLIGVICFTLIPVLITLVLSFTDWNYTQGFGGITFVGIRNFTKMFQDSWFLAALANNIKYSLISVPLTIVIAFVFAVITESFLRCKTFVKLCIFIPYITSLVVACYVWRMMLSKNGIIIQLLKFLGLENPPSFLGSSKYALYVLIVMAVWINVGYVYILYLSGIQSISAELYESAQIDGASWLRQTFSITIPLVKPTTFFVFVTQIIFSFRVYDQVQILTDGGPGTSTEVLAHYIYVQAFRYYKMGYASAVAWVLFLVIFILTLIQWKGQKKWEN